MLEKEPPLPIGYGEGRLQSQSAHWRKERKSACVGNWKKNSLLCIIVLRVLLFRIGHRKRKCHWVELIQENYMDIFEHRFLEKISNFEMKKNILSK